MTETTTNTSKISRIQEIFKGKFSKHFLIHILVPMMVIVFAVFYALAWLSYSNFDWTQNDISFLGAPELNPNGWYYWAIGMALTGVLYIPVIPFVYKQLISVHKIGTKIGIFFLILSSIGTIGIGIIPQFPGLDIFHVVNATFAFGGLYLSMFNLGGVLLRDKSIRKSLLALFMAIGFGGPVGFCATQGYRILNGGVGRICPWVPCPCYLEFSTWEWMLLFFIFADLMVFLLIVPEHHKLNEHPKQN
jgi:hypothetical membrane protein